MAKEPENHTLVLLREIRTKQDEHSGRFDAIDRRLAHLEEQQDDLGVQVTYALGLATNASLKAQTSASRAEEATSSIEALLARVEELEKR